jgi:hypothetical protein
MPSKKETVDMAKPALLAASLSLTVFWILNIFKEAFAPVKKVLGFYAPVGPLLGLFIVCLVVFFAGGYVIASRGLDKRLSDKKTLFLYVGTVILFFLMVFPPFFEPIVQVLAGK